ncbi:3-keto-steroid reductase [Suhomyces tanzawaensis NRRL Y-17324]|uniref:3beta-hydroxysteroid 3-dehydrogenase n=1 Tax=Suhomyces tanzawaensis NRRL Y-17324 TaxID=984487 RepID=A0A1E4SDS9_9ASCO|nr:3-keto-steroid reductase [Suhomyces tanzawaensis NRRL Y-17324]ODV77655.1 3-keto-steroid reductase [Suhomyces tanzawaensis NRRL Y-17324]
MSLIREAKVAVITGTTSNLGLNVAYRLLEDVPAEENLTIVVTSRTLPKVNDAIRLLKTYAEKKNLRKGVLEFDYLLLDFTNMVSVLSAYHELSKRYTHIDYFIANAAQGVYSGIHWPLVAYYLVTDFDIAVKAAPYRIQRTGVKSADGLGLVFQANVFGPYYLVSKLTKLLKGGKVIWVSSVLAEPKSLSFDDLQLVKSDIPYEGSKRLLDLMFMGSYKKFSKQGVYHNLVQPGIFTSFGFYEYLNFFTYFGMLMSFYLARLIYSECHNVSGYNAANALVTSALNDEPQDKKIGLASSRFGREYIVRDEVDATGAEDVAAYLDKLVDEWDENFKDQIVNSRQM